MNLESNMSTPMDLPSSPPIMQDQQRVEVSLQLPDSLHHDSGFESGNIDSMYDPGDIKNLNDFDTTEFPMADLTNDTPAISLFDSVQFDFPANNYPPVFDDDSTFGGPTPQPEPSPAPQSTQQTQQVPPQQGLVGGMPPPGKAQTQTKSSTSNARLRNPMLAPRPAAVPQLFRTQSLLPKVPASDPIERVSDT